MLRFFAVLFGIAFIFAGVSGFVPSMIMDNLLFGYFEVNSIHNVAHIVIGVIAIMASTNHNAAKLFFQIVGLLYALLAIAGFVLAGNLDFMMMHFNMADNLLHIGVAAVALIVGFSAHKRTA
jgi:hypothetical protein